MLLFPGKDELWRATQRLHASMLWQETVQFLPKPVLTLSDLRGEEIKSGSTLHCGASLGLYHICITHCRVTTILLPPSPVPPKHSPHKQHTSYTAVLAIHFWRPLAPVCLCPVLRYTIILSLFHSLLFYLLSCLFSKCHSQGQRYLFPTQCIPTITSHSMSLSEECGEVKEG